jgi:hypothetical protein
VVTFRRHQWVQHKDGTVVARIVEPPDAAGQMLVQFEFASRRNLTRVPADSYEAIRREQA